MPLGNLDASSGVGRRNSPGITSQIGNPIQARRASEWIRFPAKTDSLARRACTSATSKLTHSRLSSLAYAFGL